MSSSISPSYVVILSIGKVSSSTSSLEIVYESKSFRSLSTHELAITVGVSSHASSASFNDFNLLFSDAIVIGGKPFSS